MPTNANTFNSRVTSEALEAKFRAVFPSQGGAELGQDLFASGVIQPVIDFSSVAEGSGLSQNLQTAWDFSTGHDQVVNVATNIITNPGFWLIDVIGVAELDVQAAARYISRVQITDGFTTKTVWQYSIPPNSAGTDINSSTVEDKFVVFVRSGDTVVAQSHPGQNNVLDVWYRQIADVYGNLTNPLGFTSS